MNYPTVNNEFSTPCPEWCTIGERNLIHEDGIWKATGNAYTTHSDTGFNIGADHVCLVREDELVNGEVVTHDFVAYFGTDHARLTVADLLARADMLRVAAGKYAPILDGVTA